MADLDDKAIDDKDKDMNNKDIPVVGRSAHRKRRELRVLRIETLAGVAVVTLLPSVEGGEGGGGGGGERQVQVDMGKPELDAAKIPTKLMPAAGVGAVLCKKMVVDGVTLNVSAIGMGNPHAVVGPFEYSQLTVSMLDRFGYTPPSPSLLRLNAIDRTG